MSLYNRIIDLQKLHQAWERVKKNKPAAGVDHITFEQFDENKTEELKQLHMELYNHKYEVLPVKRVMLYKGEKEREIALYSMRDKVVQQSIATELNRIYDNQFSTQSFAYRNNKSALNAVNSIEELILTQRYKYVAKLDISHYFDNILWNNMLPVLKRRIKEDDVLELIEESVKGRSLEDTGELVEKKTGIYQGASISPILSNIYLMDFDNRMTKCTKGFFRYSDDILLLGEDKEEIQKLIQLAKVGLEQMGLNINEKKSRYTILTEGVDFLGYHFSDKGKAIPAKAEANLNERLELMWLTSAEVICKEKIGKAIEIIGGWEQYFREKRMPTSIFEYVALVYAAQGKEEYLKKLIESRKNYNNMM